MPELKIHTDSRIAFVDITKEVNDAVSKSKTKEGLCNLFVPHTTAAVIVSENWDPDVITDMTMQLEIFVVRLKAGLAEQARSELTQAMAKFKWPPWPAPITEYYLGKMTLDDLLHEAASDSDLAQRRKCEAYHHAVALQNALGAGGSLKALDAAAFAECKPELANSRS